MQENQLDRLFSIISEFREDIDQIQNFLESNNIEDASPIFDDTTLLGAEIDAFRQKQESFIIDFFRILSISVLLGEYIFIANFFEKLNKIEDEIKKLEQERKEIEDEITVVKKNIDYGRKNLEISEDEHNRKESEFIAKIIAWDKYSKVHRRDLPEKVVLMKNYREVLYGDLQRMGYIEKVTGNIKENQDKIEAEKTKLDKLENQLKENGLLAHSQSIHTKLIS